MTSKLIPERVALRAVSKFTLDPSGCHISKYSVGSHGYAQVGWREPGEKTTGTLAHRAAWQAVHGPIPDGMTVDHECKNQRCVNVAHLRLLTNQENAMRNQGDDWAEGTCRNGHPNSERVTFNRRGNGQKSRCRPCINFYQRKYRQRQKELK